MTKEEKDLLIKDLCARLPYEIKVQYEDGIFTIDYISGMYEEIKLNTSDRYTINISKVKPYLFPLESITDEQEEEYNNLNSYELGLFPHTEEALDYLIRNHFDYRGLIEKGLAIDCTNLDIY